MRNANINRTIDLLIGCENYWQCMAGEIRNRQSVLVAVNSIYGWLVSGKSTYFQSRKNSGVKSFVVIQDSEIDIIYDYNERFELCHDDCLDSLNSTLLDFTIENFDKTISKIENRYEVDLPWRSGLTLIESCYELSRKRLHSLKRSLIKSNLFEQYNPVIQIYLKMDYTEACHHSDREFLIPHHVVVEPDRTTTKLRIVFDGSAKHNNSLSLNEYLHKRPTLLNDIINMITKLRIGTYVVTSDLEEAFLQVSIKKSDRNFFKFIWFEQKEEIIYEYKRVPFGQSCSHFLINATLRHHLLRENSNLVKHFYVDDFIYTHEYEKSLLNICYDNINLLKTAGFNMRKWSTNSQ